MFKSTYRLRLANDAGKVEQDIEFEADGTDTALSLARQYCVGRSAMLFQDGLKVADLKYFDNLWEVRTC